MPMSRAPVASGGLELALVVRLDERLQPEVARLGDEPREPLAPGGGPRAAGRGRPRRRGGGRAAAGSTTNSLARTGTETAARTARRSSTDPPNQCGSHRTEMAAAPPAA